MKTTCPKCRNPTFGTREGDTEYCTVCGGVLGSAYTPEAPPSPNDLCSLEVLFNGKRETILEISRRNIPQIEADPRYVIVGKPVKLYGAAKDRDCEIWGNE